MSEVKKRVLVAMSGGVDSSAACAILQEQGYDVVGMTMQVWDYSKDSCEIEENGTCCSSLDVDDARSVADHLDFPFYVMNCEAKFKEKVIDPFIDSYLNGKTPLPCADCNSYLKFEFLIQKMKELNCDYLATGHYAQLEKDSNGKPLIVTSEDDWKDQTYFLFSLDKEVIPKLLFPVGDMEKPKVREYAEKSGLSVARKKDSVGICFVGKKGHAKFIEENSDADLSKKMGLFRRYPDGEILGEHKGSYKFTYGQRRGLGLDHHDILFVVKIDSETNDVWLGEEKYLFSQRVKIKDCNWHTKLKENTFYNVKVRYAHKGSRARIIAHGDDSYILEFEESQRAITPGQAAVLYEGKSLVGGGWIVQ